MQAAARAREGCPHLLLLLSEWSSVKLCPRLLALSRRLLRTRQSAHDSSPTHQYVAHISHAPCISH